MVDSFVRAGSCRRNGSSGKRIGLRSFGRGLFTDESIADDAIGIRRHELRCKINYLKNKPINYIC